MKFIELKCIDGRVDKCVHLNTGLIQEIAPVEGGGGAKTRIKMASGSLYFTRSSVAHVGKLIAHTPGHTEAMDGS